MGKQGNASTPPPQDKLKFKVAPHIVEDLGLNLYTSLPRVLVEFVANAYDADSPFAKITMEKAAIDAARKSMRKAYEIEKLKAEGTSSFVEPLATRTLPDHLKITIEDAGIGMSRPDLGKKFLVAGRRRRREDEEFTGYTSAGRAIMGRKGLGKLAGFGVAKIIEVVTRKKGESHATRIVMDYEKLIQHRATDEIEIDDERLEDGGGLAESGTRVVLSRLLYDPLKSRAETIEAEIAEHFSLIEPEDFPITMNGTQIEPEQKTLAFAWPNPEMDIDEFVDQSLPREGGGEITFKYRLRFTGEKEALAASRRGVRVYAHKRLAAAPSLLAADTNMHGFRMTDYLDGIVHADFIDEEQADYIATDRQSLRWESPLLSGMYEFLSQKIKEGCYQAQKKRDADAPKVVKEDQFTNDEIAKYPHFSAKDKRMARRFALTLKGGCKQGVNDPIYKTHLPPLLRSLGHGKILNAISALADQPHPDLKKVAIEITRLMADEMDQFVSTAHGRLKAIEALRKVVEAVDFESKKEEKVIQQMFEKAPWLVDPTYTQFLTADVTLGTLFTRLAKELGIGSYAGTVDENKDERPDLVSLIGNTTLSRLVIMELKAPNVKLESEHLDQLLSYMDAAETWLAEHNHPEISVRGQLIGSRGPSASKARGVASLRKRVKDAGPDTPWKVRDFTEVLTDTRAAHQEFIALYNKHHEEAAEDADDD